jgi:hypothetical protein
MPDRRTVSQVQLCGTLIQSGRGKVECRGW